MTELVSPEIRNGARYYDLLVTPTTSHLTTATVNDREKLVFHDSLFSIGLVTESWKYGSEVQFVAFSRKQPTLERRVDKNHEYYRIECGYFKGDHNTAQLLRDVADKIDQIIGYSEPVVYVEPKRTITGKSQISELL